MLLLFKANYPVGTIRSWKGKDYVKTPKGWRPKSTPAGRAHLPEGHEDRKPAITLQPEKPVEKPSTTREEPSEDSSKPKEKSSAKSELKIDFVEPKTTKDFDALKNALDAAKELGQSVTIKVSNLVYDAETHSVKLVEKSSNDYSIEDVKQAPYTKRLDVQTSKGMHYFTPKVSGTSQFVTALIDGKEVFNDYNPKSVARLVEKYSKSSVNEHSLKDFEAMSFDEMSKFAYEKYNISLEKVASNKKASKQYAMVVYQAEFMANLGLRNSPDHCNVTYADTDYSGRIATTGGNSGGNQCLAYYQQRAQRIVLSSRFKNSYAHEYTHHLWATMLSSNAKQELTKAFENCPRAMKLFKDGDTARVERLRNKNADIGSAKYWSDPNEMFARYMEQYLATAVKKGNYKVDMRISIEPAYGWNDSEFEKVRPVFEKITGMSYASVAKAMRAILTLAKASSRRLVI